MKNVTVDKYFYKYLGEKLTEARRNKDLTLKDVAKELNTTAQTIDLYELGKSRISEKVFENLCNLYELEGTIKIEIELE